MQGAQMGRCEANPAEGLMTAVDVARHLLKACPSLRLFEPFMFGSSLRGVVSDFDILVVGPSGEPLAQLKQELKLAGAELPLDVLYLLPEEAEYTQFVTREGCIPLSRLASSE
ncbi:hypothetical protein BV349_03821 [Pseudomonas syringae pv. actinidiae]|nr:hypothetical protein BV349_03821 [Pseudomonas syringae pv. actinidiae]OSN74907.1 hypothetical protein BV351_04130 [Pseudomonas syringae pv. actinidiae]